MNYKNHSYNKKIVKFRNILNTLLMTCLFVTVSPYYAESDTSSSLNNSTTFKNAPFFINYTQKNSDSLSVAYRLTTEIKKIKAVLKINKEHSFNSIRKIPYPKKGDVTAVLFLVDISDPGRQKIIEKNISQIITIIKQSKKHHKFGLVSFAQNIQILAPLGSSKEEVIAKTKELKATGSETLLYQYIGESITQLDKFKATRRILIVLSDGKAEDHKNVYNHQYIIKKVTEKGIIIDGMAFPAKPKKENISYYQTLERLASETGGVFIKATSTGDIEKPALTKLLNQSDNGGYWEFNIDALNKTSLSGKIKATLNVTYAQETTNFPININLPEKIKLKSKPVKTSKLLTIGLPVLLLVFTFLLFFLTRKKEKNAYAKIESLDGNETHTIYDKTYKIGRNEENNLVLANQTVSSFHAQIHLNRDKEFIICDLQSVNGIIVNNEKITNKLLGNNDLFEIGEVRFRFITEKVSA